LFCWPCWRGADLPFAAKLPTQTKEAIRKKPSRNPTARTEANPARAKSGDLAKVQALLKENPDLVFSRDEIGRTPLHHGLGSDI